MDENAAYKPNQKTEAAKVDMYPEFWTHEKLN